MGGPSMQPGAGEIYGPNMVPSKRTQSPIVTGTSVLAIKFAGGVMVAADTLGSYGSMARFKDMQRLHAVATDSLLGFTGDMSDMQEILHTVEKLTVKEFTADDGAKISSSELHHYLTTIMYNRRGKMDPLWNTLIVCGARDGVPHLGVVDLLGTHYTDDFAATGYGAYLALPLMRKAYKPDLTEAEAKKLLEDCMRVCYYRDCRASSIIQVGTCTAAGVTVSDPYNLETYWEFPEFVKGGGHLNDGSW